MTKKIILTALATATTAAHAAITYIDADHSASPSANTTVGGAALASGALGGWTARGLGAAPLGSADGANFANNGGALESFGDAAGELTTTITGLNAADSYTAYIFFWSPAGTPWDIQAGLTSGALSSFIPASATQVTAATVGNVSGLNVLGQGTDDFTDFEDGNRFLYYAPIGTVAAGTTSFDVFIDDLAGDGRTWYDGVGFEPVPEPSTALLGLLGLLGLTRRRR